jgi:predicted DCC family thiol-disulfide oxidoreductase YuxK
VILFDGVCNLCTAVVRFVIPRDTRGDFRFAALQSDAARRLIGGLEPTVAGLESIVLIEGGRAYSRSTAALRIARRLGFPWSLAWALVAVPRFLRDWAYDVVARHRYRWFGKRDVCMAPTREIRDRFLD